MIIIRIIYHLIVFNFIIYAQILSPEQIYEQVKNSVVTIYAYDKDNFKISQGSGVVIDSNVVITNFHVYEGSERISVYHFGQEYEVERIIGVDIGKDIIICKVEDSELSPFNFVSTNISKIGERIYAIGSPLGYENSITDGLVSGYRRLGNNMLIQISAPISRGSSGGAVVNGKGELIGISSSGYIYQDINFAIPIQEIYELSTNCSLLDSICSNKVEHFLKCYQAYNKNQTKLTFNYLIKYIDEDSGKSLHKELKEPLTIITLDLLFEIDYSTRDLNKLKTLFSADTNLVKSLKIISQIKDGQFIEALNQLIVISKSEPSNPHYDYLLGQCYASIGDKHSKLGFYKWAFFKGRRDLGALLLFEGYITENQWNRFR